jgi:enoyl-CoA hydratase/carnithine racemase
VNEILQQWVFDGESKAVELAIENDIAVIRFNRPKERNPLSVAVLNELDIYISALDENLKAVIFTGSEDVFASGANLREIAALKTEREVREFGLRGQRLMQKISDFPFPTIAAVNGFCFGGAFDLALSCSIRIANPTAVFSHPGANLGIITGWGGTQRLPRIIGEAAALEMFLTAKRITAEEALKINLVSQISESVLESAKQFAFSHSADNTKTVLY